MLRIANPGSDIDIFVRIFRDLHTVLKGAPDFDLDDMTRAMLDRNNVSSQGAFGNEALRRSTRADRSRDPLYNQSKMYAELYRTLGWLQSTTSALRFAFSWLGEHAAEIENPRELTIECILGMAYPNEVLSVQGNQSVRVFPAILATAKALGGGITRDEMIVGPLSMATDRDHLIFDEMIQRLKNFRATRNGIAEAISALSVSRGITATTMGNYTRFPIAALQWAGWCEKTTRSMLTLTRNGLALLDRLGSLRDIRLSDYKALPEEARAPFLRLSAHLMLERAGFDISSANNALNIDRQLLEKLQIPLKPDPWFSPFQQVARKEVNAVFPHLLTPAIGTIKNRLESPPGNADSPVAAARDLETVRVRFLPIAEAISRDTGTVITEKELLKALEKSGGSIEKAINIFANQHCLDNQDEFYPLIESLFRIIGFDCRKSRRGVNYDRADAMIIDPVNSIPIEVKSPGEELEISVKAIRQAVENKIILLSRKQFQTQPKTTTLAVGFNPPNERSEVRELISDVKRAFDINVGVLDIRSLAALAILAIKANSRLGHEGFTEMRGVANVVDILAN